MKFHIGTVLSITSGKLLSPDGFGGIYEILEYLSGEKGLMTHQIPRVMDEVAPFILQQYPELAEINVPEGLDSYEKIFTWMEANVYDMFEDEMLDLTPIPEGVHKEIDPIGELIDKMGAEKVVLVSVDEGIN